MNSCQLTQGSILMQYLHAACAKSDCQTVTSLGFAIYGSECIAASDRKASLHALAISGGVEGVCEGANILRRVRPETPFDDPHMAPRGEFVYCREEGGRLLPRLLVIRT
ncbi:hypothetical protein MTO96_022454 [Rhipicephalus appendiculatus]